MGAARPRPVVVLALVGLGACDSLANPYRPLPSPPYETFVTEVQPLVTARCASVQCHGTPDRTLKLYAVDFLRAPPQFVDTPLDEARLTDAELAWNYDALRIRLLGESDADHSRLLLKCLDPKHGGIRHADGLVVFSDRNAIGFNTLRAWIGRGL